MKRPTDHGFLYTIGALWCNLLHVVTSSPVDLTATCTLVIVDKVGHQMSMTGEIDRGD